MPSNESARYLDFSGKPESAKAALDRARNWAREMSKG
jgi:hypothetical protein